MFGTYLLRELTNRRKQTTIIAIGLALAIALVIIVNGVAAGVKDAQASVLASIYGVGTDITVSENRKHLPKASSGVAARRTSTLVQTTVPPTAARRPSARPS